MQSWVEAEAEAEFISRGLGDWPVFCYLPSTDRDADRNECARLNDEASFDVRREYERLCRLSSLDCRRSL